MGVHTGAPTVAQEGYVGVDVHRGARVGALAHGGQIVLSPATAALLEGEMLVDLGIHRLKDFDRATHLFQLGEGEFPPLRTPGSLELPRPPTRFLGRECELYDAISLWVERAPRVLTIVGPGGTGKTRFAIELARLLADEADGATVFLPLAPVHDSALVLRAIADKFDASGAEPDQLAAAIGSRRTHVVLDTSSRCSPASPARSPSSSQLRRRFAFSQRRASRSESRARSSSTCRRSLTTRRDLLQGTRDADERHATLRATIAWSYDLLEAGEKKLFARLSVFAAGCTLDSAETVCDADLDLLASLLDKSLLRRRTGRLGEARYWMLETIRQFAERLNESGEAETVRRRHAEQMLAIARAAHLDDEDDAPSDVRVGLAERDDLRAALDWAAEHDAEFGLKIAVALQSLWNASAPDEGGRHFSRLLGRAGAIAPELHAKALRVYGGVANLSGDHELAERLWKLSLDLYRTLGSERGIAMVEHMLAVEAWRTENWEEMRRLTEHSLELARGRFPFVESTGLYLLGQLRLNEGDVEAATELTRRSADRAREVGWAWWESGQLHALLMLALERGDLEEAEREGVAALLLEREQKNRLWALYTVAGMAQVALAKGDLGRAGVLWGAGEKEAVRLPAWAEERGKRGGALLEEARPEFAGAFHRGRDLDLWDAVAIPGRGGGSDRAVEREHDAHEQLCVVVQADLPHRSRTLVPAREREPNVPAELVELPAEVANTRAHIPYVVPGRADTQDHSVDELPGLGKKLHDANCADTGDDVLLEAGLHPRERPSEPRVDAVHQGPAVDRSTHRVAARGRTRDHRCAQPRTRRKHEALVGNDDVRQGDPVPARELPRTDVVARGDREETLSRPHDVCTSGAACGQGSIGERTGDPVGSEPLTSLIAPQRRCGRPREAAVDGAPWKPSPP